MTTSLSLKTEDFEPVYGWLEGQPGVQVQVWGLENGRRVALLAYGDGLDDVFDWSNWASAAYDDPSELSALFERLDVVAGDDILGRLGATFPGVLTPAPTGAQA